MEILSEALFKLGFDWKIALVNLVNFAIIYYLLQKFVFRNISKNIAERKNIIQEGLDNASQAETSLVMAHEKAKDILNEVHSKANEILAQASKQGDELILQAQDKAKIEANNIVDEAHLKSKKYLESLEREFTQNSASLIIAGIEKILKEEITPEKNTEYTKKITSPYSTAL